MRLDKIRSNVVRYGKIKSQICAFLDKYEPKLLRASDECKVPVDVE